VPKAEVNPGILNVCFGGVIYQGVKESKADISGGGLRESEAHTRKYSRIYNFFKYFSDFFNSPLGMASQPLCERRSTVMVN
jgi:hypothetical protein